MHNVDCALVATKDLFGGPDEVVRGARRMAASATGGGSALQEAAYAAGRASSRIGEFRVPHKHLAGSGGRWATFKEGTDPHGIIEEALRSDRAQFSPNSLPDSFRVTKTLGRAAGEQGETAVRVVVGSDGKLWTAFPVSR